MLAFFDSMLTVLLRLKVQLHLKLHLASDLNCNPLTIELNSACRPLLNLRNASVTECTPLRRGVTCSASSSSRW